MQKMIQHFDSDQIFLHASEGCLYFFEKKYKPPQYGSIFFHVPFDEWDAINLTSYEIEVARILIEQGGVAYGDTVCIDFDY